jgi:serine dehydrogenase proteinase
MSGGTLVALAADEVVMCRHSVLGPVDPQLEQKPAASLIKVVEQKPIAEIDDETQRNTPQGGAQRPSRSVPYRGVARARGMPCRLSASWTGTTSLPTGQSARPASLR